MTQTHLFPEGLVTIQQGRTGNCYLLAALDCILSSGEEGTARLKSLFSKTDDGRVRVTIKHPESDFKLQKQNLKLEDYEYRYNSDADEDIFIISKEKLKEIDGPGSPGVKTNSLAVKILEHISSYYYVGNWDSNIPNASINAHNISKRFSTSSTRFVGQLINVEAEDVILENIDKIIGLKRLFPHYPVYVSMEWGQKDNAGKRHERHALRLDSVQVDPTNPGKFKFVLVNPWNNSERTVFGSDEIKKRNARFCLFHTNDKMATLVKQLFELPEGNFNQLLENAKLKKLILESPKELSVQDILEYSFFFPVISDLCELLTTTEEKNTLCQALNSFKNINCLHRHAFNTTTNNSDLLNIFLSKMIENKKELRLDVVRFIIKNMGDIRASTLPFVIDICIKEKDQELFQLVNTSLFIKHIDSSTLGKKDFLSNLIELEFSRKDINPENLREIANYIQEYNKKNQNQKIDIALSDEIIFNTINERSIKEKINSVSSYLKYGTLSVLVKINVADESLSKQVYEEILLNVRGISPNDFFTRLHELSKINPTIAQNLHHIVSETFDEKFGGTLSSYIDFLKILNNDKVEFWQWFWNGLSPTVKNALLENHVRKTIMDYIEQINCVNINLNSLEEKNLLDQRLAEILKNANNALKDNPGAIQQIKKVIEETRQKIKENADQYIQKNSKVVQNHIDYIEDFLFTFSNIFSVSEVENELTRFIRNLNSIKNDRNLQATLAALQSTEEYGPLNEKLQFHFIHKYQKITKSAEQRISKLREAANTLQQVCQDIQKLNISYENAKSDEEIKQLVDKFNQAVTGCTKKTEIQNALTILNMSSLSPEITNFVHNKKSEINRLAINKQNELVAIKHQMSDLLDNMIKSIEKIDDNFENCDTKEDINKKFGDLQKEIESLEKKIIKSILACQDKFKLEQDISSKKVKLEQAASRRIEEIKILGMLEESGFNKNYEIILKKSNELSNNKSNNYKSAVAAAKKLCKTLDDEREKLIKGNEKIEIKLDNFKKIIEDEIPTALKVLGVHRGWKQILADVANAIIMLFSLFTCYFVYNRFRFFKFQTDSEEKISELKTSVDLLVTKKIK